MTTPGEFVAVTNGEAVEAKGLTAEIDAEMAVGAVAKRDTSVHRGHPNLK